MKRVLFLGIVLYCVILLTSCSQFAAMKKSTAADEETLKPPAMLRAADSAVAPAAEVYFDKNGKSLHNQLIAQGATMGEEDENAEKQEEKKNTHSKAVANRKIIYTASIKLNVPDIETAHKKIEQLINSMDGFIQNSSLQNITFRIHPDNFYNIIDEVSNTGDVVSKDINTKDVTADYVDLKVRQQVAETSIKRLLELMKKADKTTDLITLENEVRRLTQEVESYKGQMRVLTDKIEFSTVSVAMSQIEKKQTKIEKSSTSRWFRWISEISLENTLAPVDSNADIDGESSFRSMFGNPKFSIALPAGFVKLEHTEDSLTASTPEDYRMRVNLFTMRQKTELDYWAKTLMNDCKEVRGYTIESVTDIQLSKKNMKAKVMKCLVNSLDIAYSYDIYMIMNSDSPDRLLTIEYARPKSNENIYTDKITESIKTIHIR